MGCHTSKDALSELDTAPARRRCRANLKLDISIHSSTSSSSRDSTFLSEDSPFKKLRLLSDESDCSNNNKASPSPYSEADTAALTPVAVQAVVPGVLEKTYSRSCPTGDSVLDSKPNLLSGMRDKATAVGDSTDELSTGSEVESRGRSEDYSGEESVFESESEVHDEGERVEAAATGASTRMKTEQKHESGWLSDSHVPGHTSARERAQEPSAYPKSTPQRVALCEDPSVPAELQRFLEQHRRPRPETANGSTSPKPPPSRVNFKVGLIYEGQLRRNDVMPHGWGCVTLSEGAAYEGEWSVGRVHGKGALRLPNGNAYWGSWALGRKHGLGTFVWADGSRHDGYYRAGMKSGVGTLHYASGAIFEGQFEADRRHGVGRLELPDGSSYDGEWARDVPHGLGVFVDAARGGERFEGSWERGVRSGGGRLVQGWADMGKGGEDLADAESWSSVDGLEDSAWYSGNFKDGLPHGEGAMGYGLATFCGHVEHGEWTGGGGILDLGDGRGSFEGTFSDGLPRASGRWRWEESGIEMDCTFEEGYASNIWPS